MSLASYRAAPPRAMGRASRTAESLRTTRRSAYCNIISANVEGRSSVIVRGFQNSRAPPALGAGGGGGTGAGSIADGVGIRSGPPDADGVGLGSAGCGRSEDDGEGVALGGGPTTGGAG